MASCKILESKKARRSIKSHVLEMTHGLWDRFRGLGSEKIEYWNGIQRVRESPVQQ